MEFRGDGRYNGTMSSARAYLQLFRIPNVFTAVADVVAGFLFVRIPSGGEDAALAGLLIAASASLYLAGMVFNDLFDRDVDARERPQRPIPSGAVSVRSASRLAWGLWTGGLVLASAAAVASHSPVPLLVAGGLAVTILLYDGLLKATVFGPTAMGLCRGLNVLLGMSGFVQEWRPAAFLTAGAIGVYIMGVTWFARSEADRPRRIHLAAGLVILLGGVAMLFPLPALRAAAGATVEVSPDRWRLFLLLFAAVVASRCTAALWRPTPAQTQTAVKVAILSLIFLDAGICFLVAGPIPAVAVLALLIPANLLGRFVYST